MLSPQPVTDLIQGRLPPVTTTGQMLVFKVKTCRRCPKARATDSEACRPPNSPGVEEAVAGTAVFGAGKHLVVRTSKGNLDVSPEELRYMKARAQRGGKLPKGYQEVKGIEVLRNLRRLCN